jgi:hypothetical protein
MKCEMISRCDEMKSEALKKATTTGKWLNAHKAQPVPTKSQHKISHVISNHVPEWWVPRQRGVVPTVPETSN